MCFVERALVAVDGEDELAAPGVDLAVATAARGTCR